MDALQAAYLIDKVGLVALLGIPAGIVLGLRPYGILLGALSFWWLGLLIGWLLSELDPNRNGSLIDAIFLVTGWLAGLAYALLVFGLKKLGQWGYRAWLRSPPGGDR
jgi:hypothetical protein